MNEPVPTQPARSVHDVLYTVLLGVVAFFQLVGVVTLWAVSQRPGITDESRTTLHAIIGIELCFLFFDVGILILRIALPAYRKWPTLALNIVLLMVFPFGTALSIYGFWKVDKSKGLFPIPPQP